MADSSHACPPAAQASKRSLGFWALTCLVIGNVVGSGFFLAPAALAPYGAVAIIGWLVMSIGAICLGLVVLVNLRGVKDAGIFQMAVVTTKLIPFIGIAVFGVFWIDWGHFTPINPSPDPFLVALSATAPLTMFAFLGIESATVPGDDVKNPRRTIFLATIVGTSVCALIFIFGTMVVMGVMERSVLIKSSAPFSDAASSMWGDWAGYVIAAAAMLSSLGALNGWTLLMSQVPMAAARHGVLPPVFMHLNSRGVPAKGICISVGLSTLLLVLQSSGASALIAVYDFVVDLATVAEMIPYVFCTLVEAILIFTLGKKMGFFSPRTYVPVALVAFFFSMWTIYGSGPTAGMWGLLLLLSGLPFYMFLKRNQKPTPEMLEVVAAPTVATLNTNPSQSRPS